MAESQLSLQEAVSTFNVLKASDVLKMNVFKRYQDLEVEWIVPKECYLLLFISHRWETPHHPDPNAKQIVGVRRLINLICDVCQALLSESNEERLECLPSFRCYGAMQAAILLSRLLSSSLAARLHEIEEEIHKLLPEHIGIWYDYACLPQKPRSLKQENDFNEALIGLPELLRASEINLVALRDDGDNYENRAWCLAEARLAGKLTPINFRIDKIGTMFDYPRFNESRETQNSLALQFATALTQWEDREITETALTKCLEIIVLFTEGVPYKSIKLYENTPILELARSDNPAVLWIGLLLVELASHEGEVINLSDLIMSF